MQKVLILDVGSQYTQLIARRVRQLRVYCEIHPHSMSADAVAQLEPQAIILSGGPSSVFDDDAPGIDEAILGSLPGVVRVRAVDGTTRLTVTHVHQAVPALMTVLQERHTELSELTTHHATLEDVFMSLTGRNLRDG